MDGIVGIHDAVIFSGEDFRGWHGDTLSFHTLPNIRKKNYYPICMVRDNGDVIVRTYDAPDTGTKESQNLKVDANPPELTDLTSMPFIPAPQLAFKR